ncbi:MAG TPA: cation diffusion facilitator family transporter [Dehalococcoidia bacterium]|nr:cation diffusion facilitator family transporter [Dehalococcoidia bacterium]
MSGHAHQDDIRSAASAGAGRLRVVLALTGAYLIVEVAGGLLTNSLALIADAGHMLTDVAGVSMALFAIWFATRPAPAAKSYGYYRLEILAAVANGLLLIGISGYILFEAYQRLREPAEVMGGPMLGIAAVGLLVNLVCVHHLFHAQKTSLNIRGAFLEVVSDLLGSVAVILAGIVVLASGFNRIDPVASIAIGALILPRAWALMSEAFNILLEGAPSGVNMAHVREHILSTEGVAGVHDLHAWTITSGMNVVSAHVVIKEGADPERVLDGLNHCLANHFDIEHSTFQLETLDRQRLERMSH